MCFFQGRNSLLIPGVGCGERRPSLLCVLEQHARRQSTLSLLSADYGLANSSRRLSTSSRVLGVYQPRMIEIGYAFSCFWRKSSLTLFYVLTYQIKIYERELF